MISDEELEKLARDYADECDVDSHRGGPRRQAELSFIDGFRMAEKLMAEKWPTIEDIKIEARESAKLHAKRSFKATVGKSRGRYDNKIKSYFKGFLEGSDWLKQKLFCE
jgi:hypothetical protein